ncbi:HNH endonuclease [Gramella sp. Hel_I_59]|uniref:HNH endonuclease n=1 Tax=Gramella sp. Hel_I_59 TaxID=1249978 RepID=UPI00115466EF|nr:HNH endonuclease [Gramella sp. Hel_I_59]TQI71165.1 HNH endonuclease [Gramella sp. Hel_I_59]
MSKRKSLSKKVRFEVFKRDKFQCQYCGKSAPDIVLNVDHIDPVANGGSNDLINLITSCFDCNQGKKARLLSDDSVIKKQRKQLEKLQERREQLELMLEWKKSLTDLESDKIEIISDYWGSLMHPFSLNENGKKTLEKLIRKFSIEDVLEAIDVANEKYLKFDEEGEITKESVENAFNKVGGICALKNMPELKKKLAYIKGICRNRFSYWDNQKGSIILNNYVTALQNFGWSDEKITQDLEEEVMPRSIEANNWSQWKNLLESWTEDVNNWEKENLIPEAQNQQDEYSFETLEKHAEFHLKSIVDGIKAVIHIGAVFENFKTEEFLKFLKEDLNEILKLENEEEKVLMKFIFNSNSMNCVQISENEENSDNYGMLEKLQGIAIQEIETILNQYNLNGTYYSEKDKKILRFFYKQQQINIA